MQRGPIKLDRVVSMLLLHDIGEIDIGDTIAYATEGMEQRKIAEQAAVKRICAILAGRSGHISSNRCGRSSKPKRRRKRSSHMRWTGRFPIILNLANNGQSWRENGIRYEQVITQWTCGAGRMSCAVGVSPAEARRSAERRLVWVRNDRTLTRGVSERNLVVFRRNCDRFFHFVPQSEYRTARVRQHAIDGAIVRQVVEYRAVRRTKNDEVGAEFG